MTHIKTPNIQEYRKGLKGFRKKTKNIDTTDTVRKGYKRWKGKDVNSMQGQ